MTEIEIGKFTLESLTTGMYNNPEIVYREYIQNAVDSFDNAITSGLMERQDCRIEIIVDSDRQEISIRDNGLGIGKELAQKTLLDIGNSNKRHTTNRGFRGIGRLGGLSYCRKLSFCTSVANETEKTIVTFNCDKLKELLIPGQAHDYNLQEVISAVTEVKVMPEQSSTHYFIVKMEGVDDIESLLNIDYVRDYISQTAPIPFRDKFYWGKEIKKEFKKYDFDIAEYGIFLGKDFENLSQVFKPYKITFDVSARSNSEKDEIHDISYYEVRNSQNELLGIGWYAELGFFGTISDELFSGIRIRSGNILIGDSSTLSPFFIEKRFNGWCIGELYILSNKLIPNARRDSFESNATYKEFCECISKTIGTQLGIKIRNASKARNNPVQKVLTKTEKIVKEAKDVLESGFNSSFEKEQITKKLEDIRKELYVVPKNSAHEIIEKKNELVTSIQTTIEEINESRNYKTKNDIPSSFSKDQKKMIQIMLEVLSKNFEREIVDSLYKEFLKEINNK